MQVFGIGVYGVGIDVSLSGPTPWHVHGTASLSFFFFSIDIGIDFTWGDNPNTHAAAGAGDADPGRRGAEGLELEDRAAAQPEAAGGAAATRSHRGRLVLHPAGTLQVSQRAIPLDLKIDKVGSQAPSDANQFAFSVAGGTLTKVRELTGTVRALAVPQLR